MRWPLGHLKSSRQYASKMASMSITGIVEVDRMTFGERIEDAKRYRPPRPKLATPESHNQIQAQSLAATISDFNRDKARFRATRTAPMLLPTATISSADRPTTTRKMRISRCLAGKIAAGSPMGVSDLVVGNAIQKDQERAYPIPVAEQRSYGH